MKPAWSRRATSPESRTLFSESCTDAQDCSIKPSRSSQRSAIKNPNRKIDGSDRVRRTGAQQQAVTESNASVQLTLKVAGRCDSGASSSAQARVENLLSACG